MSHNSQRLGRTICLRYERFPNELAMLDHSAAMSDLLLSERVDIHVWVEYDDRLSSGFGKLEHGEHTSLHKAML